MALSTTDLLISAVVFVSMDGVYLNFIKKYFNNQIKAVQGKSIELNLSGVLLCYTLLLFGINYFIIGKKQSITDAFLLGITIYGVYELTNYALLKDWSVRTVLMDTAWGGVLFAMTTFVVYRVKEIMNFHIGGFNSATTKSPAKAEKNK